jgi:hypothetical protein
MHFGKIVNDVISAKEIALEDAASYAGVTLEKLLMMLNRYEWTTTEVKQFSVALDYDLGKHLSQWDIDINAKPGYRECNFYITFSPQQDSDKMDDLNISVRQKCEFLGLECL